MAPIMKQETFGVPESPRLRGPAFTWETERRENPAARQSSRIRAAGFDRTY